MTKNIELVIFRSGVRANVHIGVLNENGIFPSHISVITILIMNSYNS